ncbi:MAG: hypothetical protein GY778_25345 [bacterium]|nr:hypothetical protein [bacterium]
MASALRGQSGGASGLAKRFIYLTIRLLDLDLEHTLKGRPDNCEEMSNGRAVYQQTP